MSLDATLAKAVDAAVARHAPALADLSRFIHANPELCYEEHKSAAKIVEVVRAAGYDVETAVGGVATAFRARAGKKGGPRVAVLAEYDALPNIGHACGHNLIATGGVGAFLAAAEVAERAGGEVVLVGTPAEEGGGGKIKLIEAGVFEGFDAAMMFHPFDRDLLSHPALANVYVNFTFHGRPAHAAAAPHEGRSALTACMDTFRLVDGQRVHFRDRVRVHGYISKGGDAVNVIPELAQCKFSVRAPGHEEMERVRAVVERCARGAAIASDVELEIEVRRGYRDMVNNMALARCFGEHLGGAGRTAREGDTRVGAGSTDMGDVSHVVPSIHPYLAIVDEGGPLLHNHEFVAAAESARGLETALVAARTLAKTALDVLTNDDLRRRMRDEWLARTS